MCEEGSGYLVSLPIGSRQPKLQHNHDQPKCHSLESDHAEQERSDEQRELKR
jgi:hypothetical protein